MAVEIDGVQLHLAHPDELNVTWVGQEDVMRQLLAAWLVLDTQDLPMNPRSARQARRGQDHARLCCRQTPRPRCVHSAGDRGHPPRGSSGHAGDRRRDAAALCRLAAGHRNDPRRHRCRRRRQPHEREKLGVAGSAAGQPPLRGIHRGRHQDQSASALPPRRHHERRRLHLRSSRVHPFAPTAA